MLGSTRPKIFTDINNTGGTPIERVAPIQATELDSAALEARIGKKQGTERTTTQTPEPAVQTPLVRGRQESMGKNHRHTVAFEYNLANPSQTDIPLLG